MAEHEATVAHRDLGARQPGSSFLSLMHNLVRGHRCPQSRRADKAMEHAGTGLPSLPGSQRKGLENVKSIPTRTPAPWGHIQGHLLGAAGTGALDGSCIHTAASLWELTATHRTPQDPAN